MAEIIKINDSTWRIEDNGVRIFLLCGSEKAVLIDTGRELPDAKDIAESLTSLPVALLNTHADMDHTSGNGAFDQMYMSPAEEPYYREKGGAGTVIPVREGDVIDLGGRPLMIIDIPGHTPGSIAILDVKSRVLIGGDSVQDGTIFMFNKGRDMVQYVPSMEHLLTFSGEFDTVYPSHGTFPVGPDLIPKLIEGAKKILAGEAEGTPIERFGKPVMHYVFPYAGFFCDMPK